MQFKESPELVIAGLQTAPIAQDPAATLQQFADWVENARTMFTGLDMVVAPELHLSAPGPLLAEPAEYADEVAVDIPGPLTETLCALAKKTGLWLLPGSLYERTEDGVANTGLVVSPDGELVTHYRKCFPWQPYECTQPGSRLTTFDIPGAGRVGLLVCYDGMFPELPRQLAWWGAQLIVQPMLTTTADREAEKVVARATAIVNQVAVVSVNAASPAGAGRSIFVDAEGNARVEAGSGEEVLVDVVDFATVDRVRRLGTFGMNRLWEQFDRSAEGMDLPMYGAVKPRPSASGNGSAPDAAPAERSQR
jgi:formamidase